MIKSWGFGYSTCVGAAIGLLTGCAQTSIPYMQDGSTLRQLNASGAGKITHIVYIVQENRSFDNMFQGYPGANTVSSGKLSNGQTVKLAPVKLSVGPYVINHDAQAMFAACHAGQQRRRNSPS